MHITKGKSRVIIRASFAEFRALQIIAACGTAHIATKKQRKGLADGDVGLYRVFRRMSDLAGGPLGRIDEDRTTT